MKANTRQGQTEETRDALKKPYETPALRREARVQIVTAGSFDLVIPHP